MRRKKHAADISDAARIDADLSHYAVVFVKGPGNRVSVRAETIRAAWETAAKLNEAHGKHGRRAVIYAVLNSGATLVAPDQEPPKP